ncbi:MAG TPA: TetR family transcriptional regulator [Stellaceae bacterium]|nr:TetR family transcriptional regulator [Stellaceae bacterium]
MAKRAGRKTSKQKSERGSPADAGERMLDAALALAAERDWAGIGLGEVAQQAGLPLAEAYAACRSKLDLLAALTRRLDQAALAAPPEAEGLPRERLFDLLMRRFDALQPHRRALRSMLRGSFGDPAALLAAPALLRSMAWMLEAAAIGAGGWRGALRVHVLAGVYLSVLRVFLGDESADLAATMAALDRRLRAVDGWLGGVGQPAGGGG